MLKEENAVLLIDGKRVESDYTFVADSEKMKVEVSYTFDASELGGQNLVTFEELYDLKNPEEPKKVAEHRLKLKYYFDVSDTREGKYKRLVRPVSLWSVSEEQQESVKENAADQA